jgi:hypothetical protein
LCGLIAVRFLAREEWEPRLRQYHCAPLEGKGPLNTAEFWRAAWGFIFTVPIEDDGACYEPSFRQLILDIVSDAPEGYVFD